MQRSRVQVSSAPPISYAFWISGSFLVRKTDRKSAIENRQCPASVAKSDQGTCLLSRELRSSRAGSPRGVVGLSWRINHLLPSRSPTVREGSLCFCASMPKALANARASAWSMLPQVAGQSLLAQMPGTETLTRGLLPRHSRDDLTTTVRLGSHANSLSDLCY